MSRSCAASRGGWLLADAFGGGGVVGSAVDAHAVHATSVAMPNTRDASAHTRGEGMWLGIVPGTYTPSRFSDTGPGRARCDQARCHHQRPNTSTSARPPPGRLPYRKSMRWMVDRSRDAASPGRAAAVLPARRSPVAEHHHDITDGDVTATHADGATASCRECIAPPWWARIVTTRRFITCRIHARKSQRRKPVRLLPCAA